MTADPSHDMQHLIQQLNERIPEHPLVLENTKLRMKVFSLQREVSFLNEKVQRMAREVT